MTPPAMGPAFEEEPPPPPFVGALEPLVLVDEEVVEKVEVS
jgi:hypothetical protein